MENVNTKSRKKKPTMIHIVLIEDASGSMNGEKYKRATEGIQNEISVLRDNHSGDIQYTLTIVEFSGGGWPGDVLGNGFTEDSKHFHCLMKPVRDCQNIFHPKGVYGRTPLYKTVGEVLEEVVTKKQRNDKVLVKIYSDGIDNASKGSKYANPAQLKALINDLQDNHNFTIVWIGTEMEISEIRRSVGVEEGNTLIHNNTGRGIELAYEKTTRATLSYSKVVADSAPNEKYRGVFFKESGDDKIK